ncbi:hypothetical protein MMC06_002790 [Schaereria dolodes]|nr:hypothetical protein [Schaereria dolodes]
MSRRVPNPAADRAAQNQQTIKSLLKLQGNKGCADCKRNKHPRWASWNLGVFVCIRCSGIHRGMGTHISRVKSVDLDSWTDEQLQSVLRWGNGRANKYWEAKLAPGHVPSEAKIENFIRTKYESKRWVMDGPMPDPSTLDTEGDDDVPLNLVQEKAKLDRSASQKLAGTPAQPSGPPRRAAQNIDLIGDDVPGPPVRPNTTDNISTRPPPPRASTPSKQLLGLDDFLGGSPDRPASASSTQIGSTAPSRPDLKQSILSLYATAPRSQPQAQPQRQNERQASFGGMHSSTTPQASSFGGLNDAFSGLSFAAPTSLPAPLPQQQVKQSPFTKLGSMPSQRSAPAPPQITSPPQLSGGGFFDTGPKPPPKSIAATKTVPPSTPARRKISTSGGFGDFSSALIPPSASSTNQASATSTTGLFDFPMGSPAPSAFTNSSIASPNVGSPFNLSSLASTSQPTPKTAPASQSSFSGFSNADAWGSNDAWAMAEPSVPAPKMKQSKSPSIQAASTSDFGWGGSTTGGSTSTMPTVPKVAPEEDFGGWNSATPATPPARTMTAGKSSTQQTKSASGFGGSDDLFSNVWE